MEILAHMASWFEQVRLPLAVVLVAAAVAYLLVELRRSALRRKVRREYARTEEQLRTYTVRLLREEHEAAERMVRERSGAARRDAAALLMQLRYEKERSERKGRLPDRQALEEIRANLQRLQEGEAAVFPRGRVFLRAYYAPVDGSLQPYGVNVPKSYDGSRPFPLVLSLHGLSGFRLFQCTQAPAFAGAITVSPQGRGATDYMYLGEEDILAVIA